MGRRMAGMKRLGTRGPFAGAHRLPDHGRVLRAPGAPLTRWPVHRGQAAHGKVGFPSAGRRTHHAGPPRAEAGPRRTPWLLGRRPWDRSVIARGCKPLAGAAARSRESPRLTVRRQARRQAAGTQAGGAPPRVSRR